MLNATPFAVVADFYPAFATLDKFEHARAAEPGADRDHLRHRGQDHLASGTAASCTAGSPGSSLLECEGAGHMVILERHKQVTAELDDLISLALASEGP